MTPSSEPDGDPPTARPVKALRFVALLAVVALGVAATGVNSRRRDENKLAHWTLEQAVPNVAVVKPAHDGEAKGLILPGDVEANYSAAIHGQAAGYVRNWSADIGAKVKRGQILAVVDTPELDQRVTAAEGELAKAKAKQDFARVTASRWKTLSASSAVSQQALDEKESDLHSTDADVSAAQANLDRLRALKAFSKIEAPFDGVVTARNVDIGSLVSTNNSSSAPLFVVADVSRMRIYVRAPEVYSSQLREGLAATLTLSEYPGRSFPAKIATTSDAIDAKSRALLVELVADNPEGALKPGAFAEVKFELPPDQDALSLPASALLFRDSAVMVAAVDRNNKIRLKKIGISRDYGSHVDVSSGIAPNDEIVRNPAESLAEGDEVRVVGGKRDAENAGAESKLAEGATK